jgi:hypothetical protein
MWPERAEVWVLRVLFLNVPRTAWGETEIVVAFLFKFGLEVASRRGPIGNVSRITFDVKGRKNDYDAANGSVHVFISVNKFNSEYVSVRCQLNLVYR